MNAQAIRDHVRKVLKGSDPTYRAPKPSGRLTHAAAKAGRPLYPAKPKYASTA